ncbi:MAG: leucine-rich repeat domain-containing protein, partial [Clostridia bacterium]|nr:leucine-rich repeat domain-containing protein [Clostridia bacterium]
MNTAKSKSGKIIWVVLAVVLIAFLSVSAWLSLPAFRKNSKGASDTIVSNTSSTQQFFKVRPYIVASSEDKAAAYAEKLGIPNTQYEYASSNVMRIENGVWKGMETTELKEKYAHFLLPNDVTAIDAAPTSDIKAISTVYILSITADEGSNLESLAGATSEASTLGGGWLERLDLINATKLKTIPAYTFKTCNRLQHVILPNHITSIGDSAIVGNALCHISLPSGLGADGAGLHVNAFKDSGKLVDIELPANANSTFVNKVNGLATISDVYM